MSDNIPFDIQTEILKRAPVESLIRFRSVSKSWKSLIDSSEFIAGYHARKTQLRSLLIRYRCHSDCIKYQCVNRDTFIQQQDLTPNVSALMKQFDTLDVIGYSRGLFCFGPPPFEKEGMIVLWNPSIRRSVGIRGSFQTRRVHGYLVYLDLFGFVVCPVTNEPTIVKLVYPWKAEIFTLSSKVWTVIQCSKPRECKISLQAGRQVVIGSCIYRVAYEAVDLENGSLPNKYMIISFDLNVKEFKAIDLPDKITNPFTSSMRIYKLKKSLVVIVPHSVIKVWKMEPDCSFTQLFTINTLCISHIVGFRKNGELVVGTQEKPLGFNESWMSCALEVYDPCSKQITNLGRSGQIGSFFIFSYKETLLLLDHSDSCEYPEIN